MGLGLTNIATINQAQTLSPQVQLTIKLLSLNNVELESYLEKKIEDNPLLIEKQNTKEHELRIQKFTDKYSRNSSNLDLLNNICSYRLLHFYNISHHGQALLKFL